jgi:hypothetical protein
VKKGGLAFAFLGSSWLSSSISIPSSCVIVAAVTPVVFGKLMNVSSWVAPGVAVARIARAPSPER